MGFGVFGFDILVVHATVPNYGTTHFFKAFNQISPFYQSTVNSPCV